MTKVKSYESAGRMQPPYLKKGDEVAIISPSFCIDEKKLTDAARLIERWGLKVRIGKNAFNRYGPFAGTDEERLADLDEATADPSVKAVICSRGGYGISRIIDRADFSSLERNPKWYAGFSDITVLHMWLREVHGIMSVHGEMPLNFYNPEKSHRSIKSLKKALFGSPDPVKWRGSFYRARDVEGEITGGNLSMICSLAGTKAEPSVRGKILFLEDVGENYYHIDRMFTSLRLSGKLEGLAALVIGGMNKMEDTRLPWPVSLEDTIAGIVNRYDYPVFFGFPGGHLADNRAFYIGGRVTITVSGRVAAMSFG